MSASSGSSSPDSARFIRSSVSIVRGILSSFCRLAASHAAAGSTASRSSVNSRSSDSDGLETGYRQKQLADAGEKRKYSRTLANTIDDEENALGKQVPVFCTLAALPIELVYLRSAGVD